MNTAFLIACLVFISVCCLFAALYRWVRRINEVQLRLAMPVPVPIAIANPQRQRPLSDRLNRHLGGSSLAARVERQLTASDTNLSVGEYLLIQTGCAVVGSGTGVVYFGPIRGWFVAGDWWGHPTQSAISPAADQAQQSVWRSTARFAQLVGRLVARRLWPDARLPTDSAGDARSHGDRIWSGDQGDHVGL